MLNVATTPLDRARAYAEQQFKAAGKDLDTELPDFDHNYGLIRRAMGRAKDYARIDMPVIRQRDMKQFAADLKAGRIDIFKPWAKGRLFVPPNLNRETGKDWLRLGFQDGDIKDDMIGARWTSIPAKKLLPTQRQIWLEKVIGSIVTYGTPKPGSNVTEQTIIVSKEGYILDGHHRFGQAMVADPNLRLKALFIPIDIDTLVKVGRTYGNSIGNEQKASVMKLTATDRAVVRTLLQAKRRDLAVAYAKQQVKARTSPEQLPPDVRDAWEQLQAAKKHRYPSDTISNLWRAFQKAAKRAGINPMDVQGQVKAAPEAHHFKDGKDWYADTAFMNSIRDVWPQANMRHMGFGEFELVTPDGTVQFDRMRGKDFPGKSGRSHKLYDDKNGKVVDKLIKMMEQKKASTLVGAAVTAAPKFKPGDKVRYSAKFLKSTGQTSDRGRKGVVVETPAGGMRPPFLYVQWNDEKEAQPVKPEALSRIGKPDYSGATTVTAADPTTLLHKYVRGIGTKLKLDRYKKEPDGTKYWLVGLPKLIREAQHNLDMLGKKDGIETDLIAEKARGEPATLIVWIPKVAPLGTDAAAERLDKALIAAKGTYRQQVRLAITSALSDSNFDAKPLLKAADDMVDTAVSDLYKKMVDLLENQAK